MTAGQSSRTRLIVILLVALALLLALIVATGGGSTSSGVLPATVPILTAPSVRVSTQQVRGRVRVQVKRLGPQLWRFVYLVQNTGLIPIAGFQINSNPSNLFHLRQPRGWTAYGTGVCHGRYPGVLIYWSTSASSLNIIPTNATRRFSFLARSAGVKPARYSLSWRAARPQFGNIEEPSPSSMPASGKCNS